MTKKQALKILVSHQLWRLGDYENVTPTDSKKLTEALNIAIEVLKDSK